MKTKLTKKRRGQIISIFLIFIMLFCSACGTNMDSTGNTGNQENSENVGSGEKLNSEKKDSQNDNQAMGRYIENEISSLKDYVTNPRDVRRMEDGSLAVFDIDNGMWTSADNGETWNHKELEWFNSLKEKEAYIMSIGMSPDGYFILCHVVVDDLDNEDGNFGFSTKCLIVKPDGTLLEGDFKLEDSTYIINAFISEDGRMFASAMNGAFYEINKEDGSSEELFQTGDYVYQADVKGNHLVCASAGGIAVYDLTTNEKVEDKALDNFVTTILGRDIGQSSESAISVRTLLEEENIMYILCEKGIYRHVIGGTSMEQILDGTLSSLSNPAFIMVAGILSEDNSFYVLFANLSLIHYTYDSDTPTVPNNKLKAYSLKENSLLRQAIATYQINNTDTYVDYEVGIEENSSVTREDALKKLNTEIIAGTGPDLILLDDMPIDSYINKGILLDISSNLEEILKGEDVFTNIVNTFKKDSGTYAVPTGFTVPFAMGNSEKLNQITNIKELADLVDQIRKEKEEGLILGARSEENLIAMLLSACEPSWKTETGKINENALIEFFTYAKQIWEAESNGFTDEIRAQNLEELKTREGLKEQGKTDEYIREGYQSIQPLNLETYEQALSIGEMSDAYTFDIITSMLQLEDRENDSFSALNLQTKNVYIPKNILGINAKTTNATEAVKFLATMIGKDCIPDEMSLSVNKNAWRDMWNEEKEKNNDNLSSIGVYTQDGFSFSMTVYPSPQVYVARLEEMGDTAITPYIRDSILEKAVYEVGTSILNGDKMVNDGVAEIIKKLTIYMAE